MALQKREKTLVYVTGGLLVVLVPFLFFSRLGSIGGKQSKERDVKQEQVDEKKKEKNLLDQSGFVKRLTQWQKRSLPTNKQRARSDYQAWLRSLVDEVGFDKVEKIGSSSGQPRRGVYTSFTFSINGQGTLDELTRFLYEFYSVGHLHKIGRLEKQPIKGSNELTLMIVIEALLLPGADRTDELSKQRPKRLALADVKAYQDAIVPRWMEEDRFSDAGGLFAAFEPKKEPVVVKENGNSEPEPPEPPEEEFDPATQTHVSGIHDFGQPEVWLRVRTREGPPIKLHEGDPFEVGTVKGKIAKIDVDRLSVEIEVDGRRRILGLGDFLHDGVELSSN